MKRLLLDYGMLVVLLLLCAFLSVATWSEQHPTGDAAAGQVAHMVSDSLPGGARILVIAQATAEEELFVGGLKTRLDQAGFSVESVQGAPADALEALARFARSGERLDAVVCTHATREWPIFDDLGRTMPALANVRLIAPQSYGWPSFLNADNLMNVANQIAVIAIIGIGMTMVIITGGIDLSVGSLIALSSVVTALLIQKMAGGEKADAMMMLACCAAGIAVCAAMGCFSGVMVTVFGIPPFIVTLAMMMIARGEALQRAHGHSISVPAAFLWLGRGKSLGGVPNSVLLMVILYVLAHIAMTRMTIGRYIYATGGNREAARLSGVPIAAVLILVYSLCGVLAGLGGIILTSQLQSGSPQYGQTYELSVIAAVVVGGTSLSGGEGKISGTLIGAFIIGVIQNGMNLLGIDPYSQIKVLGIVILVAVLLDTLKHKGFFQRWVHRRSAAGGS
ncbi:MAG: ABC transporter permease [Thermoguttaceae bacterium]